jgi:hypothetical protein
MKKVSYEVSYDYCGGHLRTSAQFDTYSEAKANFEQAKKDADNTDISIIERVFEKKFFKTTIKSITEIEYYENY